MGDNPATLQSAASGQCSLPHKCRQLLPSQRYKARMCIFAPYHVNTVLFTWKWIWLLLAQKYTSLAGQIWTCHESMSSASPSQLVNGSSWLAGHHHLNHELRELSCICCVSLKSYVNCVELRDYSQGFKMHELTELSKDSVFLLLFSILIICPHGRYL